MSPRARFDGSSRPGPGADRQGDGRRPPAAEASTPVAPFARRVGVPALFAIAIGSIGSSILFSLGVVAGNALALTPLVFLFAAAFFVVTLMTYLEGSSLHPEPGGASTFARHAFNELWSFVAGWAILLDFLIVLALAAISISHYLGAFWGGANDVGVELLVAAGAIAWVAVANVRGLSAERLGFLLRLGLVNLGLLLAIVVVGAALLFDPRPITDALEPGSAPAWGKLIFAAAVATVALTGIEVGSGLAGEVALDRPGLRRLVLLTTGAALLVFVGVSTIALMAVPVSGGATELGERFVEAPVLAVASAFEPPWLRDAFRYAVGAVAAVVLLQAANSSMLGLSRHAYSLAINRQLPRAASRLHPTRSTPYVAIGAASLLALGLVLSASLEFLAGIFAFGVMLTFTLAHVSVIALRFREPDAARAFAVPLSVRIAGGSIPVPTAVGAVLAAAGLVSLVVLNEGARVVGGIWMVAGLVLYVVYRRLEGRPLTKRFAVPASALQSTGELEYGRMLVPVSGSPLDDDIVGTAGRLAAEEAEEGESTTIDALYVLEIPISLPIDAPLEDERLAEARRVLMRAKEVGEEYEGVHVDTVMVRGRSAGAAIVAEARRRGVEAIVLAAEEPSRTRGGAVLGGRGLRRDRAVGDTTQYVVEKSPCRVILTAPPPSDGARPPASSEPAAPPSRHAAPARSGEPAPAASEGWSDGGHGSGPVTG